MVAHVTTSRGNIARLGDAIHDDLLHRHPGGISGKKIAIIRKEKVLVLSEGEPENELDTVVTDKKGDYIRDLAPTEFHVWEDNKEQAIKSVARGSSATPASSSPTHIVLFFGRIAVGDQPYAREAAVKFIEANAAPNRQMSILNYLGSGGIKVIQNFTADSEPLMHAAKNMEASAVLSGSSGTGVSVTMSSVFADPDKTGTAASFDVRSHLHALVGVAKTLSSLPGRKAIVVLAPTINFEVQARSDPSSVGGGIIGSTIRPPAPPGVDYYVHHEDMAAAIDVCNKSKVAIYLIDVRVDHTPVENQLAPLATATGGLAIDNSKDALNALQKIAQEQEERYVLEYSPLKSAEGGCHKIKVRWIAEEQLSGRAANTATSIPRTLSQERKRPGISRRARPVRKPAISQAACSRRSSTRLRTWREFT